MKILLTGATGQVGFELLSALAPLEEGEFYAADLQGAKVFLSGEEIGRVKSIQEYPTCDAIVVEREGKGTLEVPLVEAFVGTVDVAAGRVELVSIEGLG